MSLQTLDTLGLRTVFNMEAVAGRGPLQRPPQPPVPWTAPIWVGCRSCCGGQRTCIVVHEEKISMSVWPQIVFIHEEHATEKVKLNNKRTNIYLSFFLLGHPERCRRRRRPHSQDEGHRGCCFAVRFKRPSNRPKPSDNIEFGQVWER